MLKVRLREMTETLKTEVRNDYDAGYSIEVIAERYRKKSEGRLRKRLNQKQSL